MVAGIVLNFFSFVTGRGISLHGHEFSLVSV